MEFQALHVFGSACLLITLAVIFKLHEALVLQPRRIAAALRSQGIRGPKQMPLVGNALEIIRCPKPKPWTVETLQLRHHKCDEFLFYFLEKWRKLFGDSLLFSLGPMQMLILNQHDVVREFTTCTSMDLGRATYLNKEFYPLLGDGILSSNGHAWAHQRKVLAPPLFLDRVKGMVNVIQESTNMMLSSWRDLVEADQHGRAVITVDPYLRKFSGEIISRACFGSSYQEGELIFEKLRTLQEIVSRKTFSTGIPGLRYVPTKDNREAWALTKEMRAIIMDLVKKEKKGPTTKERNLLQMVLESAHISDLRTEDEVERFIVDNCKNIYLAGYETTALGATWLLMLLATHKEWQERVRSEVMEVCKGQLPDYESLSKMKQLTMVINESLRLYPPVAIMARETLADVKLGDVQIPKGVNVWLMVAKLHTDPELWGPDSYRFNPDRFANGVKGACKLPYVYMPFGVGPRTCLGLNLAMTELKVLISMLVSKFSFSISPDYVHSPVLRLITEPEHGVDLVMEKLN